MNIAAFNVGKKTGIYTRQFSLWKPAPAQISIPNPAPLN